VSCNFVSFILCKNLPIIYYHEITTKRTNKWKWSQKGQVLASYWAFLKKKTKKNQLV
jgi:hypothetical protein